LAEAQQRETRLPMLQQRHQKYNKALVLYALEMHEGHPEYRISICLIKSINKDVHPDYN